MSAVTDAIQADYPAFNPRDGLIRDYIDGWRERLNLTDWDIRYNPTGKVDKGTTATVTFSDPDKAAVIVVRPDVPEKSLEAAVLHEMLHVTGRQHHSQAERLLVHVRDDRARVHIHEMLDEANEQMIETLVQAFLPDTSRVIVLPRKWQQRVWGIFEETA